MDLALGLAIAALMWDLGTGGWLYVPTPDIRRILYRATWWVPASLMLLAAAHAIVEGPSDVVVILGGAATLVAVGSFALPHRPLAKGAPELSRRSIVRDANRRRRVVMLGAAALLIVVAAIL
ncbi:hypothetical protein [Actinotalea sp. C106]|uniref:hypothetical protein n=1 Tax=Actinotalea sp. C106 TaxID=2908644 RepID=UPI002028FE4A|nr:hypothetical protein [Actinotalea sp. C106]